MHAYASDTGGLRLDSSVTPTATAFFTVQSAIEKTAVTAAKAAKTQTALAKSIASVTRAVKTATLGFDELHLTPDAAAAQRRGSSGSRKKETEEALPAAQKLLAVFARIEAILRGLFAPSIAAWQAAFAQLRAAADAAFARMHTAALSLWKDALEPLLRYFSTQFVPGIVNTLSRTLAPIFSAVGCAAIDTFADGFVTACGILQNAVDTLLLPTLQGVQRIFTDLCAAVTRTWDAYGATLVQGFRTAFDQLFALFSALYASVIQPVLQSIGEAFDALWSAHLAPLWEQCTALFASVSALLLAVWNNVLSPFLRFMVDTFGPPIAAVVHTLAAGASAAYGVVADVARAIVSVLTNLIQFLTNIFSANWRGAWDNVKAVFAGAWDGIAALLKGAVNGIIDCVNAMLRGVTSGINAVANAVGRMSITVPSWVPVYGGQSVGFSLPTLGTPQIPRLARGAVIPPAAEFLAVLGDQKNGRNLEAPEALIRQIVHEESGAQTLTAEQPVQLSLDGDVLYTAMMKLRAKRGSALGGAFAYEY